MKQKKRKNNALPKLLKFYFFPIYTLLLVCIFSVGILTAGVVNAAPAVVPTELPEGLSGADWAAIQAQIKAQYYHARTSEAGGYQALNPAQGWRIEYQPDGRTRLSPSEAGGSDYHLGLRLERFGYGDSLQPVAARPQRLQAQAGVLEYHWSETLVERWTNSETKLEQWFLLSERPPGAGHGQPLQIELALDSDLDVTQTGNALQFSHPSGVRIDYDRLKVWDADGRLQTAWLQLDGSRLHLLIDEPSARYPLTIDPTLQQQAYLKASNTEAGDSFGGSRSVAIPS